eukprot:COSAG02_NODE_26413_length_633_cov_1.692884_1_plen_210_part_11
MSNAPPPPPDACSGTAVAIVDEGSFDRLSYSNNLDCAWILTCSDPALAPQLSFDVFNLESGWDFLYLYDAPNMDGDPGVTLHGNLDPVPEPFVATMPAAGTPGMAVRFTSDGSVTRAGFSASMTCVVPEDPMCSNTNLVLDYTANGGAHQGFHETGHAIFGSDAIHAPSFDQQPVIVADPLDGCMGGADGGAAATLTGNFANNGMAGKIA